MLCRRCTTRQTTSVHCDFRLSVRPPSTDRPTNLYTHLTCCRLKDLAGEAVAEQLLGTCQKKWLEKIRDEGRRAVSGGAGSDMDLKNATLQHLFRLCCKTYALREQQVRGCWLARRYCCWSWR